MTNFILIAAAMTAAALLVVAAGLRSRERGERATRAEANVAVLRQQLAEIEHERASGLLGEADYRSARDDLQRRLLDDATAGDATTRAARPRGATLAVLTALPLLAFGLYLALGSPQFAARPSVAPVGASAAAGGAALSIAELEAHVARSPNDARAWVLLGRLNMQADRFAPAADAYAQAIAASPKVAADPMVWCEYADALGMAQGGSLAGGPRAAIDRALALDAAHPRALEMAGSAAYEAHDFRAAVGYWRRLLEQLAPGSAAHGELAAAIERAQRRAQFSRPTS